MSTFSYRKLFRSFRYAFRGLVRLIRTEQNAQIHFTVAVLVGIGAYAFHLTRVEATLVFFAVALVFAIEITNTAIEKLLDLVHPESHSQVAYIKDALAGAVLISATIAAVVGFLTFYPHVIDFFSKL